MTTRAATAADQQSAVDEFNTRHPVGTPVEYWTRFREGTGKRSRTRTPAQLLGHNGAAVVWLEDEASCVAISNVRPLGRDELEARRFSEFVGGGLAAQRAVDQLCETQPLADRVRRLTSELATLSRELHRLGELRKTLPPAPFVALADEAATLLVVLEQLGVPVVR